MADNNKKNKTSRFVSESQGLNDENQNQQQNNNNQDNLNSVKDYLKSIDQTTKKILQKASGFSQSSARDQFGQKKGHFGEQYSQNVGSGKSGKRSYRSFSDGFEDAFWEDILGKDFKDQMASVVQGFAKDFGVSIEDLPGELGNQLGKVGMNAFKSTKFGQKVTSKLNNAKQKIFESASNAFQKGADKYGGKSAAGDALRNLAGKFKGQSAAQTASGTSSTLGKAGRIVSDFFGSSQGAASAAGAGEAAASAAATMAEGAATVGTAAEAGATAMTAMSSSAAAATSGIASMAAAAGPYAVVIAAALVAIELFSEALGPAIEGAKKFGKSLKDSAKRDQASEDRRAQLSKERLEADVKTIIEQPFKILEDAAQKVYDAWDANLRTINQTQGYTKSDLQDLMASYSERLRQEGLAKYVSGSDITSNLTKVLESGLSGKVAEEFAYLATKLNAAIPTEDFFQYSSTYASLAANAIKNGKSEIEAISYATSELENFASNLLYSSRQLAGGFSTGLKDASSLFEEAVKITTAAKQGDAGQLSSVLTAVSAITGAIAPDLASSMTDAIVKAATGGNSSQIVALRSLAGINAGNTDFLRALVNNPQQVFSTLFTNLAKMQNMSNDNFMEVAEGLSDVFGVSMDAFARVDFNYLAKAITNMNTSNASLNENISNLKSGQSTTNADILKNQQINQYMIENGLSLVMDNEAARAIQQHMWDEQIAQQLQETTYGVEIQGSALEFLAGIKNTIKNIMNILNPIRWLITTVSNVAQSVAEGNALKDDVAKVLSLGKVGQGNARSFYNLTTRGKELKLTPNLVQLLGGESSYYSAQAAGRTAYAIGDFTSAFLSPGAYLSQLAIQGISSFLLSGTDRKNPYNHGPSSKYQWGTLGKSQGYGLQIKNKAMSVSSGSSTSSNEKSAEEKNKQILQSNFDRMMNTIDSFVEQGKTYDEWVSTARNFGISNYQKALDTLGYSEADLQGYFEAKEGVKGGQEQARKAKKEETFWDKGLEYFDTFSLNADSQMQSMIDLTTAGNDLIAKILAKNTEFKQAFDDYFVNHILYSKSYDHAAVTKIQNDEKYKSSDAIYALADALTAATDLTDPTLQTNAILSQILIVVQSIMQQNNTSGKLTLPDAIAAMATGTFNYEST
jgi:hypothetical protein